VRIGVAATPDVALPTLNWLLESEHSIDLVITQPDRPAGRGRVLTQSVVAQWADHHSIPVVKPETAGQLKNYLDEIDLVITIAYGVLLPESILSIPKHGFINLHFSLLPAYRGAAPVQRALENGETTTGVTVFQLDKGMDTGAIFTQKKLEINSHWRSSELLQELAIVGVQAISEALMKISNHEIPTPQNGTSSIASKISKAEAQIDFRHPALVVERRIRAFTPDPGSWCSWRGENFKISRVKVVDKIDGKVGQVVFTTDGVFVVCGQETAIQLLEVIPAGKKEMNAMDWARGARIVSGELLG